jgi:hypothetical protein
MTSNVIHELERYGEYAEVVAPAITLDEFTERRTDTVPATTPPHSAPSGRLRWAWAFAAGFIVVLLVIGATALLLRGGDAPPADEPATVTTAGDAVVPTTAGVEEPLVDPSRDVRLDEWQQVAVGEPWVGSIVEIEALPGGGFVAVTSEPDPWSVVWSHDGVEWRNGDSQQQVPTQSQAIGQDLGPHRVAVTAEQVVVLDKIDSTVWSGSPRTGQWEPIRLDTGGLEGQPEPIAVAGNASEILVIGAMDTNRPTVELVMWLVDPTEGTSVRALPPAATATVWTDVLDEVGIEWFDGQWILMVDKRVSDDEYDTRLSIWTSPDARSWTEAALPDRFDIGGRLTTGPSGVIVTSGYLGGDDIWHSPDGLVWDLVFDRKAFITDATYSDTLGYVTLSDARGLVEPDPSSQFRGALLVSADGKVWRPAGPARPANGLDARLAASDGKLLVRDDAFNLWLWTDSS